MVTNSVADSTAIFPMDLANVGGYDEAYRLVGSVVVPLTGGGSATVPVRYYIDTNADGNPDTLLPTDGGGNYVSPVVVAGTEQKVFAVIDMPTNAAATVANGASSQLPVLQKVTLDLMDRFDDLLAHAHPASAVDQPCPDRHFFL